MVFAYISLITARCTANGYSNNDGYNIGKTVERKTKKVYQFHYFRFLVFWKLIIYFPYNVVLSCVIYLTEYRTESIIVEELMVALLNLVNANEIDITKPAIKLFHIFNDNDR